jgi:hypothetical protein
MVVGLAAKGLLAGDSDAPAGAAATVPGGAQLDVLSRMASLSSISNRGGLLLLLLLQRAFVAPLLLLQRACVAPLLLLRCTPAGTSAAVAAVEGLGAASGGTTIAGCSNSLLPM